MASCVFCQRRARGPFPNGWMKFSVRLSRKRGVGLSRRAIGDGKIWVSCPDCPSAMLRFRDMVVKFAENVEGGVRESYTSRKV
jgi:hypothetical protein